MFGKREKAPKLEFLRPVSLEREISDAGFEMLERGDYPALPPSRFIVAAKRCVAIARNSDGMHNQSPLRAQRGHVVDVANAMICKSWRSNLLLSETA
jgi:hypothetical protein